jgi:hypothetical protein
MGLDGGISREKVRIREHCEKLVGISTGPPSECKYAVGEVVASSRFHRELHAGGGQVFHGPPRAFARSEWVGACRRYRPGGLPREESKSHHCLSSLCMSGPRVEWRLNRTAIRVEIVPLFVI